MAFLRAASQVVSHEERTNVEFALLKEVTSPFLSHFGLRLVSRCALRGKKRDFRVLCLSSGEKVLHIFFCGLVLKLLFRESQNQEKN